MIKTKNLFFLIHKSFARMESKGKLRPMMLPMGLYEIYKEQEERRYCQSHIARLLFIVSGGIAGQPSPFRDFLAEGVCDARILIYIARFLYDAKSLSPDDEVYKPDFVSLSFFRRQG